MIMQLVIYESGLDKSRAHKVPPIIQKVCREPSVFVTWTCNELMVKMKAVLHVYIIIDRHEVCDMD